MMGTINESWWKDSVIYQIYPLSFKDTSGNGKGDILGVIESLDYLNDGTKNSLGVDAIWLSPIYESPMVDWGYDVSDYYKIDPLFGSMQDFEKLVEETHKRGMKLIMDFIPNHTSTKHPWFQESRRSKTNSKRDWYIWADPGKDGGPPNNWLSYFGGPAWSKDERTNQYYMHTFLPDQADLNWRNPEVEEEMKRIMKYWLSKGVDGFRIDAMNHLFEDLDLEDEPTNPDYTPGKDNPYHALKHTKTRDHDDLFPSINDFCNVLGEERGRMMVGETHIGVPPSELVRFQQACEEELYLPFNFNLISLEWDALAYKNFIDEYEEKLDGKGWPNYVLGNHDQPRVVSRIGKKQARVAAMLLFTVKGTPFIYYGEELGMENTKIPTEKIMDPWERRVSGLGLGRDPERTPMQWNGGEKAGFSETEPWLPVNADYKEVNVEKEFNDPASILSLYRELIWYRKDSEILLHGEYESAESDSRDVFVFVRRKGDEQILIALNFSGQDHEVKTNLENNRARVALTTHLDGTVGNKIDSIGFYLRPNEGVVLEIL